jgi:hypothetical protein
MWYFHLWYRVCIYRCSVIQGDRFPVKMTGQLDFSSVKICFWPVTGIDTLTLTVKRTIRNLFRYIIVSCFNSRRQQSLEGMKMCLTGSYFDPCVYIKVGTLTRRQITATRRCNKSLSVWRQDKSPRVQPLLLETNRCNILWLWCVSRGKSHVIFCDFFIFQWFFLFFQNRPFSPFSFIILFK